MPNIKYPKPWVKLPFGKNYRQIGHEKPWIMEDEEWVKGYRQAIKDVKRLNK